jgi:predicted phage terminase large subunit-like protein
MKQDVKKAQQALDYILRTNFESFLQMCFLHLNPGARYLPNWHIEAIAYQLDRVRRGEITRLIINMPPRYLKSLTITVAFTAFLLGHEPWRKIFAISYGDDLSAKHASDFRSIVHAPWFKRAFRKMQILRSVDGELVTTKRGFRKSTSVSGPLTGLGGDLFIIDDPQKPVDAQSEARRNSLNQWVSNTLMSRLDNKQTGAIIVVMQRVHMDDLSGFLISSADNWEILSLPAIAEVREEIPIGNGKTHHRQVGEALHPELESLDTIRNQQKIMGPDVFAAQYQQSPVPAGGAMIKRGWLRYHDEPPARRLGSKIIQSWDTAAKDGGQNDWSVCTTWLVVDGNYYLLDLVRGRFEYPVLRDTAIELANRFKPDEILIEEASTGIALCQELQARGNFFYVTPVKIDRDKIGRLYVQQSKFAAGCVSFPRNASFLIDLEMELLTFPQSRNDDQVDSISQALAWDAMGYDHTMRWV